jgi:hypothetical protein
MTKLLSPSAFRRTNESLLLVTRQRFPVEREVKPRPGRAGRFDQCVR